MGLFGLCITDAVKFALTFVINMETTHQVHPFCFVTYYMNDEPRIGEPYTKVSEIEFGKN